MIFSVDQERLHVERFAGDSVLPKIVGKWYARILTANSEGVAFFPSPDQLRFPPKGNGKAILVVFRSFFKGREL